MLPVLLVVLVGAVQFALIQQAESVADTAAAEGARLGAAEGHTLLDGAVRVREVLESGLGAAFSVAAEDRGGTVVTEASGQYRSDAEHLARLGRFDPALLFPIRHRSAMAQADLQVLRSREALVRGRTMFINHVRGAVKAWGAALPSCTAPVFHRAVREHVPEELGPALLPMLHQIEHLTAEIRQADKQLAAMCERRRDHRARQRRERTTGAHPGRIRSGRC